jgi:hypothetical protein
MPLDGDTLGDLIAADLDAFGSDLEGPWTAENYADRRAAMMRAIGGAIAQHLLASPFTETVAGLVPAPGPGAAGRVLQPGGWATPAASDPWTYVVLPADYTTTSSSPQDVTGFAFTPAANKGYLIEGQLLVGVASTSAMARPGANWPSGYTGGVARVDVCSTVSSVVTSHATAGNPLVVNTGTTMPTADVPWPSILWATLLMGASPSGDFQITFRTSNPSVTAKLYAGSWFRYRELP